MNRSFLHLSTWLLACALATPLLAQPQPRPEGPPPNPPGGPGGPPGDQDGPGGFEGRGPRGGFGGGGFGGGGGGFGGPGGRGGGGRGGPGQFNPQAPEMQKFEMLRSYLDVVERFTKLANDPTAAGVAAVLSVTDILRQRGPDAAITYLTKALGETKHPVIQRAIRLQLADLYKQSGQQDKALEQLEALMKVQ